MMILKGYSTKYTYLFFLFFFFILFQDYAFALSRPYLFFGGGGAYSPNGKLTSTTINRAQISPTVSLFSIIYNQTRSFSYTTRLAFGYLFYLNNSNQRYAFGFETGFNYFGPAKTTATNVLFEPTIALTLPVTTTERTSSWSTDLEGVYHQKLGETIASFIGKLGIGYLNQKSKYSNFVSNLPGELPASESVRYSKVGLSGGVGLECKMSVHSAFRVELDGFLGARNAAYSQGLFGFIWLI